MSEPRLCSMCHKPMDEDAAAFHDDIGCCPECQEQIDIEERELDR